MGRPGMGTEEGNIAKNWLNSVSAYTGCHSKTTALEALIPGGWMESGLVCEWNLMKFSLGHPREYFPPDPYRENQLSTAGMLSKSNQSRERHGNHMATLTMID